MKYVRPIFGSKVLNHERHLTYFQFLIYKKIIESSFEDLKRICVVGTKTNKSFWIDEKLFSQSNAKVFSIHCPDFGRRHILGLRLNF